MTTRTPDLSGRRLTVATPMYEGMCHAAYARGLVELALACRERGVALSLNLVTNQPCLSRARAYVANAFVKSGADHLMLIDADMGFAAADVLALLALQVESAEQAVIGAAGSRKMIDWQRVEHAAKSGAEVSLAKVAGSMAVNFGPEATEMRIDRPHPVHDLGAAFMMIARPVFEALDAPSRARLDDRGLGARELRPRPARDRLFRNRRRCRGRRLPVRRFRVLPPGARRGDDRLARPVDRARPRRQHDLPIVLPRARPARSPHQAMKAFRCATYP